MTSIGFEFAGSPEMAGDITDHEHADVLATADDTSLNIAADQISDRRPFAHGSMTIAVAPGRANADLADLADPRLRVVLGGPGYAVGRYATPVLAKAGVTVRPSSEEADARTVLTRVRTGAADARGSST